MTWVESHASGLDRVRRTSETHVYVHGLWGLCPKRFSHVLSGSWSSARMHVRRRRLCTSAMQS